MHHEEQQRLLKQLQHGLDNNVSASVDGILRVPVTDFTCVDRLAREQQTSKSRTHHSYYRHPEFLDYLKERGESPDESRFTGFNKVVLEEDYFAAASTQIGASSGAQTHYLFGRNEPALHHYHNVHREGLGEPLLQADSGEAFRNTGLGANPLTICRKSSPSTTAATSRINPSCQVLRPVRSSCSSPQIPLNPRVAITYL
jgi:hypothetical protein